MKLTNRHVEVLRNKILQEIEKKHSLTIKSFKESEKYKEFIESLECDPIVLLYEDIEILDDKVSELEKRIISIKNEIAKQLDIKSYYNIPKMDSFKENEIKKFIETNIVKIPSKEEIESEIIISSIEGNSDFINTIIDKY